MSPLVPDVADRNPFGADWSELAVSDVETFLAATQDDEPLHWEAKSGRVTPDHVRHAVTAFANREGGYLIIGAERDATSGAWLLPGVEFPGTEPRTWLSNIIRTSVSPPPDFDVHAWDRADGRKAAVVRIQPNCGFLSMTGGRVYYRRPGESSYVENGAELHAIHDTVRFRSRALPGGGAPPAAQPSAPVAPVPDENIDMTTDPEVAARVVRQLLDSGRPAAISIYLAGSQEALRKAAMAGDDAGVDDALDRIATVAGVAVTFDPAGQVVERAIAALHAAFDLGMQTRTRGPAVVPPEMLWAGVLSRARAVGALAVRLKHWQPLRQLILHEADAEGVRVWSNWFRYGDVWVSRASLYREGNDVLQGSRTPLQRAAQHALRIAALRPDGVTDEDALITSVCQFDLLTNIVATWEARDTQPGEAAFPYFAAWDGARIRPVASRLVFDTACRNALLPDVSDEDVASLILFVAQQASKATQSLGSWGFWDGFIEGRLKAFLDAHVSRS